MQDVEFSGCKLLWVEFRNCNGFLFETSFEDCNLELASFSSMKIKGTVFQNSELKEVNFSGSDLSGAIFWNCNLEKAIFQRTILEKTDFQTSHGYIIDPEENKIKGAKFSLENLPGLLVKYKILIK